MGWEYLVVDDVYGYSVWIYPPENFAEEIKWLKTTVATVKFSEELLNKKELHKQKILIHPAKSKSMSVRKNSCSVG